MTPINKQLGYILGNVSFNTDGSVNATIHIGYPEDAPAAPPSGPQMPQPGVPSVVLPDGTLFKTLSQQSYYVSRTEIDAVLVTATDVGSTVKAALDVGIISVLVSKGQIPS